MAGRANVTAIRMRELHSVAMAQSTVHRRQMVGRQSGRKLMRRRRRMADSTAVVHNGQMAADTVPLTGRAEATAVTSWPSHLVTLLAAVLGVTNRAATAIDRGSQSVGAQPEGLVVIRRRHLLVAGNAAGGVFMAESAVVGTDPTVHATHLAMAAQPVAQVIRRLPT